MEKNKIQFYKKLSKLLDCEGVLIIKGETNWINFLKTFFPEELKKGGYTLGFFKLRNICVQFSKNPTFKRQTIIDLGNE